MIQAPFCRAWIALRYMSKLNFSVEPFRRNREVKYVSKKHENLIIDIHIYVHKCAIFLYTNFSLLCDSFFRTAPSIFSDTSFFVF